VTGPEGTGGRLNGRTQAGILAVAAALAGLAVWVTARADFLAHPYWLAAQKADLILGPVLVGLYWQRARPASRFGLLLIAYGLLNATYIAQSSSIPWLFGLGVAYESVIYLGNQLLIVAFPTGRVGGVPAKLVLAGSAVVAALNVWLVAMLPHTGAGGAISECRDSCPRNGLAVAPDSARALDLLDPITDAVIAVGAATGALLIWRFARGTRPQRRALAIGTPVALFFLGCQIAYLTLSRLEVDAPHATTVLQWTFTVARSGVWYGFLIALVAAQLHAGGVVRRLLRQSLKRPGQEEVEAMLREPLGDPTLTLRFWDPRLGAWDGPVEAPPGSATTIVEGGRNTSVAIVHDRQLMDEPELLHAAGAVALLAADNADLGEAWRDALAALQRSRVRVVQAINEERRRVASNLHDGVQQRLVAIRLRLAATGRIVEDEALQARLEEIGLTVDDAIAEVREASHALYPRQLVRQGLAKALEDAIAPVPVWHDGVGRHHADVEAAVYYCVLESVHNATKHGGGDVWVSVSLHDDNGALAFEVLDDGRGFDVPSANGGMGLQSMRDRMEAVGGDLSIASSPGRTVVSGSVPFGGRATPASDRPVRR
jgi:signal transduction histidine kinase